MVKKSIFDAQSARKIARTVRTVEQQGIETVLDRNIRKHPVPHYETLAFAKADIRYDQSGEVYLATGAPTAETASTEERTVYNTTKTTVWQGSACVIGYVPVDQSDRGGWHIVHSYAATRLKGFATGPILAGSSGTISSAVPMDGHYGPSSATVWVLPKAGDVEINQGVIAHWNEVEQRWQVADRAGEAQCTTIHLPSEDPPGIHSHLYVDALQAPHVQTEWSEQGITGVLYVAHCNLVDCLTIAIQKGLVTDVIGPTISYEEPPSGDFGSIVNPEVFAKCGEFTEPTTTSGPSGSPISGQPTGGGVVDPIFGPNVI